MKLLLLIFISICALSDIRKGGIGQYTAFTALAAALVLRLIWIDRNPFTLFLSLLPSICLFIPAYFGKEILGYADVVIFAASGMIIGFPAVLELLLLSLVINAVYGGMLLICRKKNLKDKIVFIPSILVAYLIRISVDVIG